ncbi:YsnF/AvaK domain-containing protein [Cryomorpha ignava]|uniref:YsnF/AvaK domain-containing protein n=1 Tax=Cryomorpha ignava TaxID=101383 RepID=A0A7K3WUD7_9FLAO|nr:DUF2382 domain-containing protein [Cryomorpha ignava]NEN24275.1 YsnF/AvaK domain-containing protein [Cryomorpha ignava]
MEEKIKMKKEKKTIKVHREDFNISKEVVEKGKVTIRKTVKTETSNHEIPLVHEKINIEEITVNKEVAEMPKIRKEGNTTIISVVEEVAVVTKKLMLIKEIHITKEQVEKIENIETALRKESVSIDRKG